ncbi:MAG: helix-turn-helix domain-containing protein [Acutalibacteraceae bacterium]
MTETVERIFQLMEQRNLSAYRLSHETGISQARISGWKTGKSNPKQDALEILADYFGVSVDYLLGRARTSAHRSNGLPRNNTLGPLTEEEDKALCQYLAFLRSKYHLPETAEMK